MDIEGSELISLWNRSPFFLLLWFRNFVEHITREEGSSFDAGVL